MVSSEEEKMVLLNGAWKKHLNKNVPLLGFVPWTPAWYADVTAAHSNLSFICFIFLKNLIAWRGFHFVTQNDSKISLNDFKIPFWLIFEGNVEILVLWKIEKFQDETNLLSSYEKYQVKNTCDIK